VSEYSQFRDVIKAQVEIVAGTGNVHSHLPYAADQRMLLQKFMVTVDGVQQLRGWWVERQARRVAESETGDTQGSLTWGHTFVVVGVMSFRDATDTDAVFGDLCDDVMDSLALTTQRPTQFFPGAWNVTPPRLRVQELRMIGDVLCHYAEIILIPHKETTYR
jgi:hypothetical protein